MFKIIGMIEILNICVGLRSNIPHPKRNPLASLFRPDLNKKWYIEDCGSIKQPSKSKSLRFRHAQNWWSKLTPLCLSETTDPNWTQYQMKGIIMVMVNIGGRDLVRLQI